MVATRIVKELSYFEYREIIEKYKGKIRVNPHTYFRLNEAQRKIYKDEYLIYVLTKEQPSLFGLQNNGRHAAFFKRKDGYLRIILSIETDFIEIKTITIQVNLQNIQNGN